MQGKSDSPVSASISCALKYLLHLKTEGLSNSPFKVHLAAISVYHILVDCRLLYVHNRVKKFMKGLSNVYPPLRNPVLPWDLNLVLPTLMKPPFEPLAESSLYISLLRHSLLP